MNIAVVGSGVSGLVSALVLQQKHQVSVFERDKMPGGHCRSIPIQLGTQQTTVDTGFIVFNHFNYPVFSRLMSYLGVRTVPSDMSFGVSADNGAVEYGTKGGVLKLFAQPQNLIRLNFWIMLHDIMRFNRISLAALDSIPDELSLADWLAQLKLSKWFEHYYVLAMGAAIWSASVADIRKFPAARFLTFFAQHGLLRARNRPQWYTIDGGSRRYVEKIQERLHHSIRLKCAVRSLHRDKNVIVLVDDCGQRHLFDAVVMACHSDEALALVAAIDPQASECLRRIRYRDNKVITHGDTRLMPRNRRMWASWNYISNHEQHDTLSYWMNSLQPLRVSKPVLVSLNPHIDIDSELVYDQHQFAHPILDDQAIKAQRALEALQGRRGIWYCGAWTGNGFHEDGTQSALKVAASLGCVSRW